MLLDIPHHVQSDHIHLLTRAFGRLEHVLENRVNLLWRGDSFRQRKKCFSLDRGPDPADP